MPFDDDVKPTGSAAAANLDIDDYSVDFGNEDALTRSGLPKIEPADKTSYVRVAVLTDVVKVQPGWMHYIQVGDKKHAYRCHTKRDRKHQVVGDLAPCCVRLNGDENQKAQLVFVALAVKYKNANPANGQYPKGVDTQIIWELGWLKLSQAGYRGISELMAEDDAGAHSFDFAITYRENGIGFKYVRVSNKARFRAYEELSKEILAAAAKYADAEELQKKLGKKVSLVDLKAVLAGKSAGAGSGAGAQKHVENLDDL